MLTNMQQPFVRPHPLLIKEPWSDTKLVFRLLAVRILFWSKEISLGGQDPPPTHEFEALFLLPREPILQP